MNRNDIYLRHTYSYLHLRNAVGWIGILLPAVLVTGDNLLEAGVGVRRSISFYYHTPLGDVFVGALCAVALFLFFYSGYGRLDNRLANLAGLAALGTAWFPTTESGPIDTVGVVHLTSAALLLLLLACFSMVLFTRTADRATMTSRKRVRNRIYYVCGSIIVASVVAMGLHVAFGSSSGSPFIFVGETISLIAFGVSWLTKGETLFPDR